MESSEEKKPENDEEKKRQEEEEQERERAEIEAAEKKWNELIQSRVELMRRLGQPYELFRPNWPIDVRELPKPLKRNCDKLDWDDGPADPELVREKERTFWNAAMEYRRVQNMDSEYDLIPSNMTLYSTMTANNFWYHGNLLGCKREFPSKGVHQYFFIEVNYTTRQRTSNVTACITLDDYDVDNTCKVCPSHMGILHPRKGGFTFWSKEGQSKEDLGATPASALDRVVPSPSPLSNLGDETLEPIIKRLSAMVAGGTSRPAAAAAIGTHPESEILITMPSGSSGAITKRQLEVALTLAGGGTCSSEQNNQ